MLLVPRGTIFALLLQAILEKIICIRAETSFMPPPDCRAKGRGNGRSRVKFFGGDLRGAGAGWKAPMPSLVKVVHHVLGPMSSSGIMWQLTKPLYFPLLIIVYPCALYSVYTAWSAITWNKLLSYHWNVNIYMLYVMLGPA